MATPRIGKDCPRAAEFLRTHGLTPLRGMLTPGMFQQAHPHRPRAGTILVPEVVFWLMALAALGAASMAACVQALWAPLRAALPWLPLEPVQEEAFCTARAGLPLRFFLLIFQAVVAGFNAQFPGNVQLQSAYRWKGRRLLGIDGMDTDLPRHPKLARIFPPASNQHGARGCPQARLVGLVGLQDGLCHAFRWTSLQVSEQASARRLAGHLQSGDLLLADRNFPDRATFAAVLARGADLLFHLPSNRFLKLSRRPTPSGRPEEWDVRIPLPPALRAQYPQFAAGIPLRILSYQRPGYRPSWLITSLLDAQEYPYQELVELYHQRWRQETFHREWKHTLTLSNLRSHSAMGLLKEVLVQLSINNAIRWMMAQAAPAGTAPVQLQFLAAKRLILSMLPVMDAAPAAQLPGLYRRLLDALSRQRILVRPGRSFPRRWDCRGRPKGHGKIAQPAKLAPPQENHT